MLIKVRWRQRIRALSLTAKPSGMLCSVMARAMTKPSLSSSADRSRCVSCLCSANLHHALIL